MVDNGVASPFHLGEQAIQDRLGVREKMEMWGQKGIRSFMPEQHREFFAMLPTFFVALGDENGQPWPSILSGPPGFVSSPSATTLEVSAWPSPVDPAFSCLKDGAPIGALGIQFHTRRRNRVNGHVVLGHPEKGFTLEVSQGFGNCAQYIQARKPDVEIRNFESQADASAEVLDHLDARALGLIAKADTFFIASCYDDPNDRQRSGLDMSHRGGPPGFVEIRDQRTLVWPDFKGNFFFNTLGNISKHPRCGLLFIDFERCSTLQLAGMAGVIWDVPIGDPKWKMAQRLVTFTLDKVVFIRDAIPFGWAFQGMAPQFVENDAALDPER